LLLLLLHHVVKRLSPLLLSIKTSFLAVTVVKLIDLFCSTTYSIINAFTTFSLLEGDALEGQPVGHGSLHRPQ